MRLHLLLLCCCCCSCVNEPPVTDLSERAFMLYSCWFPPLMVLVLHDQWDGEASECSQGCVLKYQYRTMLHLLMMLFLFG